MKKGMIAAFALSLSFCGSVFSDVNPNKSVKPNGCDGAVLCSSYPIYGKDNSCCFRNGGHFEVGLLFQQPWIYGTVSGAQSIANPFPDGLNSFSQEQTIEELEECFDYSAGLTVGMGYMMEHDGWFLKGDFDWLASTISNRSYEDQWTYYYITSNLNSIIGHLATICLNSDQSLADLLFNANVNIYALDVALSRGSFHSACFSYEPFVGVKALWYNGNYGTTTGSTGAGVVNRFTEFAVTTYYDAWGVGPMFGFNGEYFFTSDLSIFSDSDLAILYGGMVFRVNAAGTLVSSTLTGVSNNLNAIQNTKQEFYVPIRTILGLKYGVVSECGKYYGAIKAGYDARYVFARAVAPDMGMSGLYLSFILDF